MIGYFRQKRKAEKDEDFSSEKFADLLHQQRLLLMKNVGNAKIDSGLNESGFERLINASRARENGRAAGKHEDYRSRIEDEQIKREVKETRKNVQKERVKS